MSHQETSPKSSVKRGLWFCVYNSHFVILHRLVQHCAQISYTSFKKRWGYNSELDSEFQFCIWIGYKRNGRRSKGEGVITQNPRTTFSQLCCWSSLTAEQKPVHLPGLLSERSERAPVKGGWLCKFTPVIQGESARISVVLTHSPTHVLSTNKLSRTEGVYLIHVWRYT